MADAGWFPDPQDAGTEIFFDGENWTSQRRPEVAARPSPAPQWSAPTETTQQWAAPPPEAPQEWAPPPSPQGGYPAAAPPGWGAPAGPEAWPPGAQWQVPPAPPTRRRRKPLLLTLLAVAVLAAGLITWLAWPDGATPLTYKGKEIAAPDEVLTKAETALHTYVKSRHGAENGDTRCYFAQPKKAASGTKSSDVDEALRCGPVLFVDGDTAKPYVRLPLDPDLTGKTATLQPPNALNDPTAESQGGDLTFVRPDGKDAPSGAGGLSVPKPPAAEQDVLTAAVLGPTPSPQSLSNARMVGRDTGVTLDAAGPIPRYGRGDEARSVPSGQQLIAFQVSYSEGDVSGSGSGQAQLVVDGGAPRDVPETNGGDEWVVAAVPASGSAVLQLVNGGYTQTLTLPGGKPGAGNLAVLARKHRTGLVAKSASVPIRLSDGSNSANVTFHASATIASIDFWVPGHETRHARDAKHAILSVKLNYTDPESPGKTFGFDPQLLHLRLPDGSSLRARNVETGNFIFDVFDVPATFTKGTIQISGSERVDGVTVAVRKAVSFPVSIAAG